MTIRKTLPRVLPAGLTLAASLSVTLPPASAKPSHPPVKICIPLIQMKHCVRAA
jgi:hypothetical protein